LVERRIVRDQRRIADEVQKILHGFAEALVVDQELTAQSVHANHFFRHVAIRIEVGMILAAGALKIEHFDAADFDDAVTQFLIPMVGEHTCGFRIEQDFAHLFRLNVFAQRVQHGANLGASILK
jgi:hypothetical protein